ncbi:monovalent cation/H(+) antiporter subunit G [Streptomyces odontomachi]|uniref:monovalent cation/H(+) antiporter subunit G n=1 Tax=Streptomyces odontomachi TaxID=2944940 RepID=UPI002108EB4B|nr:monovalent cation/H(+) antiporter subunit G [Streptomyces sp. ODS25]
MPARHLAALVLLAAGCAVLVLSSVAFVRLPGPYARLHALAPAGSLGAPLVALAAAVQTGPGRAAVKLLLIGLLLAAGGSVCAMAAGRAQARRDGLLTTEAHR